MKETIYTKPLRMPDSRPTRINDTLKLIEEGGQITKIERIIGGKTEEISTGESDLTLIPGEWLDDVEEHFFPYDPSNVDSTIGYYVTGIYKIDSDFIRPLLSYEDLLSIIYCQIKDNIKNKLSEEFITALTNNSFPDNIILGSRNQQLGSFVSDNCTSYFSDLGYNLFPAGSIQITSGTFINLYTFGPILMDLISDDPKFFRKHYTEIDLCLSQEYIFAEKDDEYYLIQLTLFD